MYQSLLTDSSLYLTLLKLDEEFAEEVRSRGCGCGGTLHSARYPRKPRGGPMEGEEAFRIRRSFCCAEQGCRRRTTPPSVLFLGRKVFFGAVVVLVCVLRHGATPMRLWKLQQLAGVSARTVRRWRKWWLGVFVRSAFWRAARGRLRAPVDEGGLPYSLLQAFEGQGGASRLLGLLRFIRPLTSSSAAAGLAI